MLTAGTCRLCSRPRHQRWRDQSPARTSRPAPESAIVIFGYDPKTWKPRSSFSRTTSVGKDGNFVVRGLREGRYYVAAIPPEVMAGIGQPTPEFLEGLSGMATVFTVSAGETRTLDLRLLKFEKQ